jgi:predicted nucleic acid-binding protein
MPPVRCLIDSMIFDAIAAEPELLALVDRLTSARRLELLAAPVSLVQVEATPDAERRRRLQRVRVLVVPPAGDGPAGRELLGALQARRGVDRDDALIAAAAAREGVPLVTEDRDLRAAAAASLPEVALWTWADDLRPRVLALGTVLGGPPRLNSRRRRPSRG